MRTSTADEMMAAGGEPASGWGAAKGGGDVAAIRADMRGEMRLRAASGKPIAAADRTARLAPPDRPGGEVAIAGGDTVVDMTSWGGEGV